LISNSVILANKSTSF